MCASRVCLSLRLSPKQGLVGPSSGGKPWRELGTAPAQHLCCCRRSISRSGQKWPPVQWGTWTPAPRGMQRQENQAVMCYQTKWLKCGIPLSTGVNAVGAIALPSHRHRSLSLHLFPVLWPGTWISNCNKPRKPSSTRDHLNNSRSTNSVWFYDSSSARHSATTRREIYSSQESFTQGSSWPHESFKDSFTISLGFDHQQKSQSWNSLF